MTPFEYLKTKVVSVIRPSRVGGVGLFATRDLDVGETLFEPWYGNSDIYSITTDELLELPVSLHKNIYETFHYKFDYINELGKEVSIPKEYGKLFFPLHKGIYWTLSWPKMFLNSGLKNNNVDSNSYTLPVVIKRIKEGEEILGNYGTQFKSTPKNFL